MSKYIIRCGAMRLLGIFSTSENVQPVRGMPVIVRTERGLEAGEVLREATDELIEQLRDSRENHILRQMTAEDAHEISRIHEQENNEFETCLRCIAQLQLPMHLVDVEHVFGGERVVVYYLADGRVDFRELVKMLASEFQTRIEMRQIGVRDEAKLMADYGDCGKAVCCNTHLVLMPPVSMKMAKLQKATLDPTKISGRCGRLKCCLRYEYETYEGLQKQMPPYGKRIRTADGNGRVVGHELLAAQVLVENEDRSRKLISIGEILPDEPESEARTESVESNSDDTKDTDPASSQDTSPH